MCDYSLEHVASRPAKVGDELVSTRFPMSLTKGFAACDAPDMAVCLLPGTELVFAADVVRDNILDFVFPFKVASRTARFRHLNEDLPDMHHDALEFADGKIVMLTRLRPGQRATVLQLPAEPRIEKPVAAERQASHSAWFLPGGW